MSVENQTKHAQEQFAQMFAEGNRVRLVDDVCLDYGLPLQSIAKVVTTRSGSRWPLTVAVDVREINIRFSEAHPLAHSTRKPISYYDARARLRSGPPCFACRKAGTVKAATHHTNGRWKQPSGRWQGFTGYLCSAHLEALEASGADFTSTAELNAQNQGE